MWFDRAVWGLRHDGRCDAARDGVRRLGLGNSGFVGWAAINVVRKTGREITPEVWSKIFPDDGQGQTVPEGPSPIERVRPRNGEARGVIAVLREFHSSTDLTAKLKELGPIGYKLARLDPQGLYKQITVIDDSVRPCESYTALAPERLIENVVLGDLVAVELRGVELGNLAAWILTEAEALG